MGFLFAIFGAVFKYTIGPIIHQGGYIIHCKRNIQALQSHVDDLKAARGRVDIKIGEAERKGEHIYPDVTNWIAKVGEITAKADVLLTAENQAKIKCMLGCPNPLARHKLSRKSTTLAEVVVKYSDSREFASISYGGRTEVLFLTPSKDYEAFDSRISTLNGIIDELKNPDIYKIGLYGIGGVGKTTLAEKVVRQVTKDKLFDDVVVVRDVKEDPDIERLQQEIAEQLGMDYSKDLKDLSRAEKARRICDRLRKKKTFLVLDDIWNFFDLKVVGLPDVAACKILLISRSGELLSIKMGTQKEFQLSALDESESWNLFESRVGEVVRDPNIRTVATEVANNCGGLPIFIVTVASQLKKGTLPEWKNALTCLKTFEKKGLGDQTFMVLKWSYDQLDDEELKPLFLLCGVIAWKNSIVLDDLFKLVVGLGLLKNINTNHTVDEARNSMLSLIIKLKGFSLLQDHDDDTSVRMHDLVHDVAYDIASRDGRLLSVACGAEFKFWPETSKCSKMSIKSDSLAKLSEVLDCQKLEMFYLRCEDEQPLKVPNSFFANMENLKVLGLRNVKILTSLKFLKNLQTLCLDECIVEDIALVGELRKLEILSLVRSNIKQLAEEIGQLSCLRLLDLNGCFHLNVIPPNLLSRLTRLEDLRIRNSFIKWEAEREGERSNASLSELKHLSLLTALDIQIPNFDLLPKDLFFEKLERFHIYIGCCSSPEKRSVNTLAIEFTTGDQLYEGIKGLVRRSEDLTLQGGPNVNGITFHLEGSSFQQVKHLQLRFLDTRYILNSKGVFSRSATLEVVSCDDMKFLLSSSMARSLVQLRTLKEDKCRSMEEIVSAQEEDEVNNTDNMFSKLEYLSLKSLQNLVRFYAGSYADFSTLEEVFISNGHSSSTRVTKEIDEKDHRGVDSVINYFLFDEKVLFPSLEKLELKKLPKLKAVWQNQNQLAPYSFCRLREVEVTKCSSLLKVFVPCITERLDALEFVHVGSCPALEVIFNRGGLKLKETHAPSTKQLHCFPNLVGLVVDNSNGLKYIFQEEEMLETVPKFVFPKLILLYFWELPHLKSIFPGKHVSEWPSLQDLRVERCGQVEILAGELSVSQETQESDSHSDLIKQPLLLIEKGTSIFSNLETLTIEDMGVWSGPPPAKFNSKLKSIDFHGATISKHTSTFLQGLHNLEKITVTDSQKNHSREIFVGEGSGGGEIPQVRKLKIRSMDSLVHIQKSYESAVPIFPNLEKLVVVWCSGLNNLDTSAISFQNLSVLTVESLDGLEYLVSHHIARSLMQLTKLTIRKCTGMKVIVATEEDDDVAAHHEIAFSRLKNLVLDNLPRLQGLCLGSCNLKFPALETLNISKRLKMKLFAHHEFQCIIDYKTYDTDAEKYAG